MRKRDAARAGRRESHTAPKNGAQDESSSPRAAIRSNALTMVTRDEDALAANRHMRTVGNFDREAVLLNLEQPVNLKPLTFGG